MSSVLTDFVLQMNPGGQEPTRESFEQAWGALRGLLSAQMKRRSNWGSPPSFLGVAGHRVWTESGHDFDALDELVSQCFEWIFVTRRQSLHRHATQKSSVDGLVARNVQNFLFEVQRRHDPIGFRIFEVLRRVLRLGVEQGELFLVAGDPRMRNDTQLSRDPGIGSEDLLAVDPTPLADRWVATHLEDLVTATYASFRTLVEDLLSETLSWLGPARPGFRFGDLASPLKQRCRQAWIARFADPAVLAGGSGEGPDPGIAELEDRARFLQLSQCVRTSIGAGGGRTRAQEYLQRLWMFLESLAYDLDDPTDLPTAPSDTDPRASSNDPLPSHRQLALLLDIPRGRISGDLETLGGLLTSCRESGVAPPEDARLTLPAARPTPQNRARAALRNALLDEAPEAVPTSSGWRVGDIVDFGELESLAVYWWVRSEDPSRNEVHCVPVDTFPLLGPRDLRVESEQGNIWALRPELGAHWALQMLSDGERIDHLDVATVEQASTASESEGLQRVEDDLPAYHDWIEEGPRRAHDFASSRARFLRPSSPRRAPWGFLLAAVLALALVGLGTQTQRLQRSVQQLSEPILGLEYREVQLDSRPRGDWVLEVPTEATHIELGLVLVRQEAFDRYRIEIVAAGGRTIYQSPEMPPKIAYSLTFPIERLEVPGLEIRLYGLADTEELLDRQSVTIRRGASP